MLFTVVRMTYRHLRGHALQTLKKQHFNNQYDEKKSHILDKYQNYLFKCPTSSRPSDVLIAPCQMVFTCTFLRLLQKI